VPLDFSSSFFHSNDLTWICVLTVLNMALKMQQKVNFEALSTVCYRSRNPPPSPAPLGYNAVQYNTHAYSLLTAKSKCPQYCSLPEWPDTWRRVSHVGRPLCRGAPAAGRPRPRPARGSRCCASQSSEAPRLHSSHHQNTSLTRLSVTWMRLFLQCTVFMVEDFKKLLYFIKRHHLQPNI
jgi:hypothetical protein